MIGTRIKSYIESKGIKACSIAEKAGLTRHAFSDILCGNRKLTIEEYCRVCAALDLPVTTFLDGYMNDTKEV